MIFQQLFHVRELFYFGGSAGSAISSVGQVGIARTKSRSNSSTSPRYHNCSPVWRNSNHPIASAKKLRCSSGPPKISPSSSTTFVQQGPSHLVAGCRAPSVQQFPIFFASQQGVNKSSSGCLRELFQGSCPVSTACF